MVGKWRLCVYGTRDAALNWHETLSQHLIGNGFVRGVGFPCVSVHEEKAIFALVHGDDYCSTGSSASLSWFDGVLLKRYEIKIQRVGIGEGCTREGQIINGAVRATNEGFAMEVVQRHAELIIEQLQSKAETGVSTPGIDDQDDHEGDAFEALGPLEATSF